MIFTPKKLGSKTLERPILSVDKKFSKRFGPCAVGDEALFLNSFYIECYYYVALSCVKRIFKRVAMSKGGFTGKGVFGSIPYLVVELDDGTVKQCNFKYENDVDMLIAHVSKLLPNVPTHSVEAERRLKEKKAREEARYLKELPPKAQASRDTLESARRLLEARPEDITIVQSPVGMPGRALRSPLIQRVEAGLQPRPERCVKCLVPCDFRTTPYCISRALIDARNGDWENGLFFCGANVGEVTHLSTVKAQLDQIMDEWRNAR